jgi:hypothetical protein
MCDGYKKGGKIPRKRYTQKQKQSTNIKINIGSLHKTKSRRANPAKPAAPAMPKVITNYIGSSNPAQPFNFGELLKAIQPQRTEVFNRDVLHERLSSLEDMMKNSQIGSEPGSDPQQPPHFADTQSSINGRPVVIDPHGDLYYINTRGKAAKISSMHKENRPDEEIQQLYRDLNQSGFVFNLLPRTEHLMSAQASSSSSSSGT